mmetsp:Transcript_46200/g.133885  ORF Transcript_46200/g.133885 Transcript_46200/m.133885 type:complete len:200 (-) Transcript_46200:490-1089(-)
MLCVLVQDRITLALIVDDEIGLVYPYRGLLHAAARPHGAAAAVAHAHGARGQDAGAGDAPEHHVVDGLVHVPLLFAEGVGCELPGNGLDVPLHIAGRADDIADGQEGLRVDPAGDLCTVAGFKRGHLQGADRPAGRVAEGVQAGRLPGDPVEGIRLEGHVIDVGELQEAVGRCSPRPLQVVLEELEAKTADRQVAPGLL